MGLIKETNAQYYSGQQVHIAASSGTTTENVSWKGNIALMKTTSGVQNTNYRVTLENQALIEGTDYTMTNNVVSITKTRTAGQIFIIQLLERAIESNYGGYAYTTLDDIINNFIIAYVGDDKLVPSAKRTEIVFHAKRGLQEFSYDTLKSIKSQELTVPNSLSIVIPQDYVQHVKMSWIGDDGVKHIIYPTTLTSNPSSLPIQDSDGVPLQDSFSENIEDSTSITEENWKKANKNRLSNKFFENNSDARIGDRDSAFGQRYGLNPSTAQSNGWFTINSREGKISFSANLVDKVIILEYISDGLAYDADTKVPKLAEEAMYAHLSYSLLAGRINQPEYVVRRLKQDRSAKLRNAKIRLSNINISEITQVMRGKSKLIK
tara:strand:+ start:195 stop:1325 length:1131 start_codon:yes stop_codon:yes gene_type:complete